MLQIQVHIGESESTTFTETRIVNGIRMDHQSGSHIFWSVTSYS